MSTLRMKSPFASRFLDVHQPSSIFTYWYLLPVARFAFSAASPSACALIVSKLTFSSRLFHDDQPIGGGFTAICCSAVGDVSVVVVLPPVVEVAPVPVADVLVPGDEPTSSPPHADRPIAAAARHIINIPK
ncbi:Uncharacterised protein [Burkholderia cepacia]|uniref:Uncharacterized protein n=1 Tax=Burkholderia cepacia TaxID=292 RepID=A0AAE8NF70_BURCE|nr:Uncharacterised protein [Burkholderia cepacia]